MTTTTPAPPAKAKRRRLELTRPERRSVIGMATVILVLHLVGWGTLIARRRAAGVPGRRAAVRHRARRHRLHPRHAARLRRRPHRGHRQHDPQADDRGPAADERRLLVQPRPQLGRLRHGARCSPWASGRWPARSRTTSPRCSRSPASGEPRSPGSSWSLIGLINLVALVGILKVFRKMRTRPLRRGRARASSSTSAASSTGSSAGSPGPSPSRGTCTPWACCSGSASTR